MDTVLKHLLAVCVVLDIPPKKLADILNDPQALGLYRKALLTHLESAEKSSTESSSSTK